MKLLFLGDSITDCSHSFDPKNLGCGYVRMIADALSESIPDLQISNKGIDGFTVPRVYNLWQNLPDSSVFPGRGSFDVVSVLVGVNDVGVWMDCGRSREYIQDSIEEFAATYEDLVCDILDCGIHKLLLMEPFIFPVPASYQIWQPYLSAISERIQAIARRCHITFLPLQELLERYGQQNGYEKVTLDGIHLTEEGNRLLANAWLRALETA